jgi:hypothetical protein
MKFLTFIAILILFIGCDKNTDDNPAGVWSESVFIINEGPFQAGSGTISAFNRETGEVTPDLFEMANGRPLGNIVQSLTVHGDKAFIMVNNSNKIEVVNLEDFNSVATVENIKLPRYFIGFDQNKGYVSCWDSTVKVLDLADFTVIDSIQCGTGPDEMVISGNYLFVINSGGFGVDSTVSVIRTDNEEVVGKINVGYRPAGIQKDMHGNIWVLCSGKGWNGFPAPGDTPARLVCIDPDSHEILNEMAFPDTENHPDNLIIDGDGSILYYNHPAGVFSFPVSGLSLNEQPMINSNTMFYGLGFDEKEKMIYATDPLDYAQNGWVYRFNASDGTPVDSILVGIIPNGFWFN